MSTAVFQTVEREYSDGITCLLVHPLTLGKILRNQPDSIRKMYGIINNTKFEKEGFKIIDGKLSCPSITYKKHRSLEIPLNTILEMLQNHILTQKKFTKPFRTFDIQNSLIVEEWGMGYYLAIPFKQL